MSGAAAGAEHNPFEQFKKRFDNAAKYLKLDAGLGDILKTPTRELTVAVPVPLRADGEGAPIRLYDQDIEVLTLEA